MKSINKTDVFRILITLLMSMAKAKQKEIEKPQLGSSFFKKNFWKIIFFSLPFLLYLNTIPNQYNLDDELVTINHRLTSKGISSIYDIFTSYYYEDNQGYKYEYRPIVLVTFAIENSVAGDNPHISHFVNVVLYSICCLLLFTFLSTVFPGTSIIPLISTLIFIAHPIHTEVVASIKNRDEILALIFALLSSGHAHKYIKKPNWISLLYVLIFFSLSLLSKPTAFSFLIIIPLFIFFGQIPNVKSYIFLVLSLILPVYFLAPFSNLNQQLGSTLTFIIALLAPVFIYLYGRKYLIAIKSFWLGVFNKGTNFTKVRVDTIQSSIRSKSFFELPSKFFEENPTLASMRSYSYGSIILFLIVSSLVFIFSITEVLLLGWFLMFLTIFLTCIKKSDEKYFYFVMYLIVVKFLTKFIAIPYCLVAAMDIFILLALVFDKKAKNNVAKIGFLILSLMFTADFTFSLLILLYFLGIKFPRFKILSFLVLCIYGFIIATSINSALIASKEYPTLLEDSLTLILLLLLLIFSKKPLSLTAGVLSYTIPVFMLFFLLIGRYDFDSHHDIARYISQSSTTIAQFHPTVDLRSGKLQKSISPLLLLKGKNDTIDRPITFIEQPVGVLSPEKIRLGTAFEVLGKYLKLTLIPYQLSFYYGYREVDPISIYSAEAYPWAIVFLLLISIGIFLYTRKNLIGLGLLIYFISVVPFCSYFFPVPGCMADRFLFIPVIGFSLIVAEIFAWIQKKFLSQSPITQTGLPLSLNIVLIILFIAYAWVTVQRNAQWKDKMTLYTHDIKHLKQSAQANNLIALTYMVHSYDEPDTVKVGALRRDAAGYFKAAVKIYPSFFNYNYDLGRVYTMFNMNDSALYYFKYAYNLNTQTPLPELVMAIGAIYQQKGVMDSAIQYYSKYILINPAQLNGYINLSYIYYTQARYQKAIDVCREGEKQLPNNSSLYYSIAQNFIGMNQIDSSLYYLYKARVLAPTDDNINRSISNVLAKSKK